jgi:hypothetical protein
MALQGKELRLSQKLELLVTLFNRSPIRPVLDTLTTPQLVEAHSFLWDKMVEFHVRTQPREFRREEVTKKMIPSAKYQRMQGCDLRIDYCKGVECIWSNPVCAGTKVKNNMEVMAEQILKYFEEDSSIRPQTESTVPAPDDRLKQQRADADVGVRSL